MQSFAKSSNSINNSSSYIGLYIISNLNYQKSCLETLTELLDKNQIFYSIIQSNDHNQIQCLKNTIKKSNQKYMVVIDNSGGQDFDLQLPDFFNSNNNLEIYTYPKRSENKKYPFIPNAGKILSTYKILNSNRQSSSGRIRLKSLCQSPYKVTTIYSKIFVHQGKQKKSLTFQKFFQQILRLPNTKQFQIWRQLKQQKPEKKHKFFAITTLEQSQQLIKSMFDNRVSEYCDIGILGVKPNKSFFYDNVAIATQDIIQIIDFVTERGFNLLSIKHNMIRHVTTVIQKNGIYFSNRFILNNQSIPQNIDVAPQNADTIIPTCSKKINKQYYDLSLSQIPQKKNQTLYENSKYQDSMNIDSVDDSQSIVKAGASTKSMNKTKQPKNYVKSKWALFQSSQKNIQKLSPSEDAKQITSFKSDNPNKQNQSIASYFSKNDESQKDRQNYKQKEEMPLESNAQYSKKQISIDNYQIQNPGQKSQTYKDTEEQMDKNDDSNQLINQSLLKKKSQILFDSSKLNHTHTQKLKSELSQLLEDGSNFKMMQDDSINSAKQKIPKKSFKKQEKNISQASHQKQKSKISIKDKSLTINIIEPNQQNLDQSKKTQKVLQNKQLKSNVHIQYSQSKQVSLDKSIKLKQKQKEKQKEKEKEKQLSITQKIANNNNSEKQLQQPKNQQHLLTKSHHQASIHNLNNVLQKQNYSNPNNQLNNSQQIIIEKQQAQKSIDNTHGENKCRRDIQQNQQQTKLPVKQNDKYIPSNIIPETSQQYNMTNRQSQGNTFFKGRQISSHGSEKQFGNYKTKNSNYKNLTTLVCPGSLPGSSIYRQNLTELKVSNLQSNSNLQKSINASKNDLPPIIDEYGLENSMTNKQISVIKSCAYSEKSNKNATKQIKNNQANPDYFIKKPSTQSSNSQKKSQQNSQTLEGSNFPFKKRYSFARLNSQNHPQITIIKQQQCNEKYQKQAQYSKSLIKRGSQTISKRKTSIKPTNKIQSQKKIVKISTAQLHQKQQPQQRKDNAESAKRIISGRSLSSNQMPFRVQYNFSLSRQKSSNNDDQQNKNGLSRVSIKYCQNKTPIQNQKINRVSSTDILVRDIRSINYNDKSDKNNSQKQKQNNIPMPNHYYNTSTSANIYYQKNFNKPTQRYQINNNDYKTTYINNQRLKSNSNSNNYNNSNKLNLRPSRVISTANMNLDNFEKTVDQKGRIIYRSRSSNSFNLGNLLASNNQYQSNKNPQRIYYRHS